MPNESKKILLNPYLIIANKVNVITLFGVPGFNITLLE